MEFQDRSAHRSSFDELLLARLTELKLRFASLVWNLAEAVARGDHKVVIGDDTGGRAVAQFMGRVVNLAAVERGEKPSIPVLLIDPGGKRSRTDPREPELVRSQLATFTDRLRGRAIIATNTVLSCSAVATIGRELPVPFDVVTFGSDEALFIPEQRLRRQLPSGSDARVFGNQGSSGVFDEPLLYLARGVDVDPANCDGNRAACETLASQLTSAQRSQLVQTATDGVNALANWVFQDRILPVMRK